MNAPARINPYLTGNFAPIRSEDDFCDLRVTGAIPKNLNGTLYRTGPNPQFEPLDANYHWFAGDGMLHSFVIGDGKASYRNRYVPTPKYRMEHEAGRALFGTFGNPLTSDPSVIGKDGNTANTNIVWHGGRLLALMEAAEPFEVDPATLAGRGYVAYGGAAQRFTAHPKLDPETGEMVFFAYSAGEGFFSNRIAYGVVDRAGKVARLDMFDAPYCSMIHDFLVTKNYVAFPVLPLTGDLGRVMKGGPAFAWEPDKGSHIGVMRRDAGVETIRWFTTDPCYVFHPMNMWDDGEKLYADVMRYDTAPLFPNADGTPGTPSNAKLVRWTFDLAGNSNSVKETPMDDLAGEFPRLDERRAGLSYRHGYYAADTANGTRMHFNAIAHMDWTAGKRALHRFAPGDAPGEPVFVPKSASAAEGEGWLLSVVYRGATDTSDLVVLDAQDVGGAPVATVHLPRRVPFGFHGNWRPGT